MSQHNIYEGTAQELARFLAQSPTRRFRLIEMDEDEESTSVPNTAKSVIDAENAAAIALLKSWREQEATDDPEEISKAEEDLAEFKRRMNANRTETGERLVYP